MLSESLLRSDSVSGNIDSDVREPSSSLTMFTVTSGGEFQDKNKHMFTCGEEGEMNLSFRDENSSSHNFRNEGVLSHSHCPLAFSQPAGGDSLVQGQHGHPQSHESKPVGEKCHICEVCHAQFSQKSGLSRHRRIHTGKELYKCDVCSAKFAQ